MSSYAHHYLTRVTLDTDPETAFKFLDNPRNLSSHMGKSSWMMAGSKMDMVLDSDQGRLIGSVIKLRGKMMGLPLFVQEAVTKRIPNQQKAWETFGDQRMLIIDQYRIGFHLKENLGKTDLEVWIDYDLPKGAFPKLFSTPLARLYAKWCTEKMARDAYNYFHIV